jgi:hypothetical protein
MCFNREYIETLLSAQFHYEPKIALKQLKSI